MSTKLGLHITSGSRDGYGPVTEAAPAAVLSIGDGAPLKEAKEKSAGRTITIYRDMKVYESGNAPRHFPQMTEAEARAAADQYWPRLRAEYEANEADYYQPTNEIGGSVNDPKGSPEYEKAVQSFRNLIAYETRLMELAEAAGIHLAVASLSGGTPGDFELWKELFVPFIRRAGQGGHIYSRHAYGPGLLTKEGPAPSDGNAGRPFREAQYLREQGIHTPLIITEAGPNAGYQFPGTRLFMEDVERYDRLCQAHDNVWAFCCWTYGGWHAATPREDDPNLVTEVAVDGRPNIERASGRLAAYLQQQGGAVRPTYPTGEAAVDSDDESTAAGAASGDRAEAAGFSAAIDLDNVAPGQPFQATWTFRNSGSTTWDHGYRFAYTSEAHPQTAGYPRFPYGETTGYTLGELGAPAVVRPGDTVSLTLSLVAPEVGGTAATNWQLQNAEGRGFGPIRWLRAVVGQVEEEPVRPPAPVAGAYRYRGREVAFFTGIHGPGSDHSWRKPGFVTMIERLNMPILFMSHGINPDFAHLGNVTQNIVRLYHSPNPERTAPDQVYEEVRDDQLRRWWERGYRRFLFFNEVNLTSPPAQSDEGRPLLWNSPEEFARFLRHCLQRARADFPGIQLYTTPMSPQPDVGPWREQMWSHVQDLVSGYAMHAYSGNNVNAHAAADTIAHEVTSLQRKLRLQVPLVVTEAAVNSGDNAAQKAQVARLLPQKLAHAPGVEGVFWYAADWASDFDKNHEGWFRNGIADAYLAAV